MGTCFSMGGSAFSCSSGILTVHAARPRDTAASASVASHVGKGRFIRLGCIFSEPWAKRNPFFQGLENAASIFPKGLSAASGLEKSGQFLPNIGKRARACAGRPITPVRGRESLDKDLTKRLIPGGKEFLLCAAPAQGLCRSWAGRNTYYSLDS